MFIAIVSIIDIVIYVATLAYNGISNIGFLAPTNKAMYMFGSKDPYSMRYHYQVWRFITPIFLHGDFTHLVSNVVS